MSKNSFNRKDHWESIYATKKMDEVSWFQQIPKVSLDFFGEYNIPKKAKILDVGGGDGFLVDHLMNLGYTDISVLDISENAIDRAKKRLGEKAKGVTWIVSDITNFQTNEVYDVWHDRAVFHFLTASNEIQVYKDLMTAKLQGGGYAFIGTFSTEGPTKCSGIEIHQYSEAALSNLFSDDFDTVKCIRNEHKTPFNSLQDFLFCTFRKK